MKTIEIFDPAMCCPTGLCGTNINPELMRIAVVIETLKRQGVVVTRHNLRDEPQVLVFVLFIGNKNQTVQSNESGGCCPANTQSVQPEEKKCCGTQPQPEQEESCCDTTFN